MFQKTEYKSIKIFPELHSEEIQEIINRPPNWMIKWGFTFFLILLLLLFFWCWMIKYPDVVSVSFTLTANDTPKALISRSDGKIQRLLVKDGQSVIRGQLLAFGESTANHYQILNLSTEIDKLNTAIQNNDWNYINSFKVNNYQQLGEIQNDFHAFVSVLTELNSYLPYGYVSQKRKLLKRDISDLQSMEVNLNEQLVLLQLDLDIGRGELKVQEKLLIEKVISESEYKREKMKFLSKEIPVKNLLYSLIQNNTSQNSINKEILEIDNLVAAHKNGFHQAMQSLKNSIEMWKQRYILSAPIQGRISFSIPWQEHQHIAIGQEFLTIEPAFSEFQGLIQIPHKNLGKIREGQRVLVKLDGYPYREFGMLEGSLSKISSTLGRDSVYWGHVALPKKLKTRYGRMLSYKNGQRGTAEIITMDRRLSDRIFSSIRNGEK